MINLQPLKKFRYPIIAESINPDFFQGKKREEIEKMEIWEGNKKKKLGKLLQNI